MKTDKSQEADSSVASNQAEDGVASAPAQHVVCGDDVDLDEGKMPAVNDDAEDKSSNVQQDEGNASAVETKMVDGDAVKAPPVIDVDDVRERNPPPTSQLGTSGRISDVRNGITEAANRRLSTTTNKEKEDIPLCRHPDMDDTSGPKDHLSAPMHAQAGPRTLRAPTPPSLAAAPSTAVSISHSSTSSSSPVRTQPGPLTSHVSDWMSTIPEPVALRSSPARRRPTAPGAFAVTPPVIGRSANTDGDDETTTTVGTIQILSTPEEPTTQAAREQYTPPRPHQQQQQDQMLVHATLVEDGDAVDPTMLVSTDFSERSTTSFDRDQEAATNWDERNNSNDNIALVEAKPLEVPQRRTFREAIRSKWTQLHILVIISLISVAIVLGVLAIQRPDHRATSSPSTTPINNSNTDDVELEVGPPVDLVIPMPAPVEVQTMPPIATRTSSPSGQPSAAPSWMAYITPTAAPTFGTTKVNGVSGPTEAPTGRPTAKPLTREDILDILPEYTRDAIVQMAESPQKQAYEWLWNDPNVMDYTIDRMIQRFALMTVLNAVGMDQRVMRSASRYGMDECDWNALGLRCDNRGVLSGIHLARVGLKGYLPLELGLLTSLQKIDMSQNELASTLPVTVGEMMGLRVMNFGYNALSGTLPYSLAYMKELRELILNDNNFQTTLPAEIGWLTHLRQLRLSFNSFTGTIPGTIRLLTSLETFMLNDNKLSGSLPEALGSLLASREMEVQSNKFEGTIPMALGELTNLLVLNLSENRLTGQVPYTLGMLTTLTRLELQDNSLRGTLPVDICALKEFFVLGRIEVDCKEVVDCPCTCVCHYDQDSPGGSNGGRKLLQH